MLLISDQIKETLRSKQHKIKIFTLLQSILIVPFALIRADREALTQLKVNIKSIMLLPKVIFVILLSLKPDADLHWKSRVFLL